MKLQESSGKWAVVYILYLFTRADFCARNANSSAQSGTVERVAFSPRLSLDLEGKVKRVKLKLRHAFNNPDIMPCGVPAERMESEKEDEMWGNSCGHAASKRSSG
jgi:hypothetical protein